jgi:hypothetical protein
LSNGFQHALELPYLLYKKLKKMLDEACSNSSTLHIIQIPHLFHYDFSYLTLSFFFFPQHAYLHVVLLSPKPLTYKKKRKKKKKKKIQNPHFSHSASISSVITCMILLASHKTIKSKRKKEQQEHAKVEIY